MKKLTVLALLALSLFAARPVPPNKSDNPLPTCNPCEWVR